MAQRVSARLTVVEGRRFGVTVGLAFLGLSVLLLWRDHAYGASVAAALGALLTLGGLTFPTRLGPLQKAWMRLASVISKVTTPVFMGMVYYVALAPTGLLMRAFGHNPIARRHTQTSFWITRPPERRRSDIERQF